MLEEVTLHSEVEAILIQEEGEEHSGKDITRIGGLQ
jgi:hypothetical protein